MSFGDRVEIVIAGDDGNVLMRKLVRMKIAYFSIRS